MARMIPKPKKERLAKNGRVSLLLLTDPQTLAHVFAVKYPHKVGNEESSLFITSQFLKYEEAEAEFKRMSEFFRMHDFLRKKRERSVDA